MAGGNPRRVCGRRECRFFSFNVPFKQEISPRPWYHQTQDNKPTTSLPVRLLLKGLNLKVGREQTLMWGMREDWGSVCMWWRVGGAVLPYPGPTEVQGHGWSCPPLAGGRGRAFRIEHLLLIQRNPHIYISAKQCQHSLGVPRASPSLRVTAENSRNH